MMRKKTISHLFLWLFAIVLIIIGILNIVLVHIVPGILYLLVAGLYLPPVDSILKERWNIKIPLLLKIILGIIIIMFTLGVSDLGDIIDKM